MRKDSEINNLTRHYVGLNLLSGFLFVLYLLNLYYNADTTLIVYLHEDI